MQNDRDISVTLLLNGGHSRTLYLKPGDPLLTALLAAMGEKCQTPSRPPRLFNLRVDDGRHSLIVSSSDVAGLLIDPPLMNEEGRRIAGQDPSRSLGGGHVKSPYMLMENFVEPALHAELMRFIAAREKDFVPSTVSTEDTTYRRSLVLHEFPKFADYFRTRIRALAPQLIKPLGISELPIGEIECQLTASNDGDYFRLHNDSGSPDTLSRQLTYVYYFNKEPKAYSGGEFRLYNSNVVNNRYECGEKAIDLEPKNNSILFFPSYCHHEVLPIRCPSQSFIDSRFTINGWVRRAA